MSGERSAADFLPRTRSLRALRAAARECHGCPLWEDATQTVFGSGPRSADLMLVGEQPGDREDREGEPFVSRAVVALGATASRALFGSKVKVTKDRGGLLDSPLAPLAAVTIHPSAVLRVRDREERHAALAGLAGDLSAVAAAPKKGRSEP